VHIQSAGHKDDLCQILLHLVQWYLSLREDLLKTDVIYRHT